MRECTLCGREFTSSRRWRCATCSTKIRRYRLKKAAVEYLGGKCSRCGFKGEAIIFDFHHRDPQIKKFSIGDAYRHGKEEIVAELDKCDLLCANCHRLEHLSEPHVKLVEEINYLYDFLNKGA